MLHIVCNVPRELHAFIRDHPDGLDVLVEAFRLFVTKSYGYKAIGRRSAERVCWRELGAIINLHPFGDESTPYPKWKPHLDVVLAGWRFKDGKVTKLRETWPQLFGDAPGKATHTWRESLRRAFMKVAPIEIQAFLTTKFWCGVYIAPGAGHGRSSKFDKHRTGGAAWHTISYSARPLVNLEHYRVERDQNGHDWLVYEFQSPSKTVRHRVRLEPAVSSLYIMRAFFSDAQNHDSEMGEDGRRGKNAHRYIGILSGHGGLYQAACRAVGRQPVPKREKAGVKRVSVHHVRDGVWRDSKTGEPAPP